jgi:hypothetical protein
VPYKGIEKLEGQKLHQKVALVSTTHSNQLGEYFKYFNILNFVKNEKHFLRL